ncbi:MAG TPA: delta-60 repeat domain-containing protein [Opitutaceae bacterium]
MASSHLRFLTWFRFLLLAALAVSPRLWALSDGFDPNANGNVYAVVVQADGRVLLGGSFTTLQPNGQGAPVERHRIGRVNPDGSLDPTFGPLLNGDVTAIAVQADGRILVGGKFTEARSGAGGTVYARNGLVRLAADGTVDPAFNPAPGGVSSISLAPVYAIVVQADGRIVVGGAFTTLQPGGSGTVYARNRLARLNADGSVDTGFNPGANNIVFALALQADQRIVVGGAFTAFQPAGSASIERRRLARVNTDGSLDATYHPRANNRVMTLAIQADGKVLAGGDFTEIHPEQDETLSQRAHLARIEVDGRLDSTFNPRPNATLTAIAVQRDGRILVAGQFSTFLPSVTGTTIAKPWLARLTTEGAVDTSFNPQPNAAVAALGLYEDGRVVVGGYFSRVDSAGATTTVVRNRAARLLSDGSLDGAFASDVDGWVNATAQDNEGRILLGGFFDSVAGVSRTNLARIRADGTLDPTFKPEINGQIHTIALQSDGDILIGGDFTIIDGTDRTYLARLNPDGSLDADYDPAPGWSVYALLLESDGRLLVGGSFTTFQPNGASTSTSRPYLARLNANGTLDSWSPAPTGTVYSLVRQSDGKLLVGGSFTFIANTTRNYLARLNTNLSIDTGFNPSPNALVRTIAVQPDAKIVFGGTFTTLQLDDKQGDDDDEDDLTNDDADRDYLARVNADGTLDLTFNPTPDAAVTTLYARADGKLLIGGAFTTLQPGATGDKITRQRFARLNADGTVDTGFDLQTNDNVFSLQPIADGEMLVSGRFTAVYGASGSSTPTENHVVRLAADGSVKSSWLISAASGAQIEALALQTDGKILVGGRFTDFVGSTATNLLRLYGNGNVDADFRASTDGTVRALLVHAASGAEANRGNAFAWLERNGAFHGGFSIDGTQQLSGRVNAIAVQADGAILLGGYFSNRAGTTSREIIRIRPDGTVDTTFLPRPDGAVNAIVVQPDGKILIAGAFAAVSDLVRHRVARLNPDGSVDDFTPIPLNGTVNAMTLLPDGRVVVGGLFTAMEVDDGENDDDDGDGSTTDDTAVRYVAMMSSTGAYDTSFRPIPNGIVESILPSADGRLYLGGSFSSFTPAGTNTAVSRNSLALVGLDGAVDATFNPGPNAAVRAMALQADGKLVIGGDFTQIALDDGEADDDDGDGATDDDALRFYLARLNADGSLDRNFRPTPNAGVNALAIQPSGGIYVGGAFTTFTPNDAEESVTRRRITRLNSDGTVDLSFNANANGTVYALVAAANDAVLAGGAFTAVDNARPLFVGGEFTTVGGLSVPRLARLNLDGNPDTGFVPNPNAAVQALAEQADGRVLVAGAFTSIAGSPRTRLARFGADGVLDDSYAPAINGAVTALALQTDGAALIGGDFSQVGGAARTRLARVRADGTVDPTFAPGVDGAVTALAVQADGKVLVAGSFATVAGGARSNLARLNADGSLDTDFNPAPNGAVASVAVLAGGRIAVAGSFTAIGGAARERVARLQANGSLDTSFDEPANAEVRTLVPLEDGRMVAAGAFTTVNGAARTLIARLGDAVIADQRFTVGAGRDSVQWVRTGGAAALTSVEFAWSANGTTWTTLGAGTRGSSPGTWQWSGGSVFPANAPYSVRARGILAVTQGGSGGVVEAVWQFVNTTPAGYGYAPTASDDSTLTAGDALADEAAADARAASAASDAATNGSAGGLTAAAAANQEGRLVSLTASLALDGGASAFVGFVIEGSESKTVWIRAAGARPEGLTEAIVAVAPSLVLTAAESPRSLASAVGATPSLVVNLAPGAYQLDVKDAGGQGGWVRTEISEVDSADASFVAMTAVGTTATGASTLQSQLVIGGDTAQTVLIRGLGPALAAQGIGDGTVDPAIEVRDASGAVVALNDDWGSPESGGASAAALAAAAESAGGMSLASGSRDAAVLVTLAPGTYTVTLADPEHPVGLALLEVLAVP